MSKYINVYMAYGSITPDFSDWTYLYKKPETLFSLLNKNKNSNVKDRPETFFACPAMSNKMKKILVFKNSIDCAIHFNFEDNKEEIIPLTSSNIFLHKVPGRVDSLNLGPTLSFGMQYNFFSEEPLLVYFTPPFFQKPGYTNTASMLPGEFDIGRWFRPCIFEVQTWSKSGVIELKDDEPIVYAEFKTDKKIKLHRFEMTERLAKYAGANLGNTPLFGRGQSLFERYERFKNYGMREKVLTEIKKNLIDEEPFIF